MLPTLEHRDLIQSNYQMCRFLFPLHHFSVCNIRICPVLIQLLGQAQNLHMYTRSNATGDWTLHMTVSHPSKGSSAPENRSGVMQGMITPKKMPVHTNSRQKSRSTFVGILVLEGLIQSFAILWTQHLRTISTGALCTCSVHWNQWESRLLPGLSHAHRNYI